MKKRIALIIISISLIITCFYTLTSNNKGTLKLSSMKDPKNYATNASEIISKINNSNTNQDYSKYVDVKLDKPRFQYNKTTEEKTVDNNNCNIIYRIQFLNISNESFHLNYKLFIPEELTKSIIYAPTNIGPEDAQPLLKPGKTITSTFVPIMKHTDKLNANEKKLLDKYINTLYCELKIDGQTFYLKITGKK